MGLSSSEIPSDPRVYHSSKGVLPSWWGGWGGGRQWLVSWPQGLIKAPSLLPGSCQRSLPQPRQAGLAAQARTDAFSILAIATGGWESVTQWEASPFCQHSPSVDTTLAPHSQSTAKSRHRQRGKVTVNSIVCQYLGMFAATLNWKKKVLLTLNVVLNYLDYVSLFCVNISLGIKPSFS